MTDERDERAMYEDGLTGERPPSDEITIVLKKDTVKNLLLTVHGAGNAATTLYPFGNFWAGIQEIERQYAQENPRERTDWSVVAMEVRSRPGRTW